MPSQSHYEHDVSATLNTLSHPPPSQTSKTCPKPVSDISSRLLNATHTHRDSYTSRLIHIATHTPSRHDQVKLGGRVQKKTHLESTSEHTQLYSYLYSTSASFTSHILLYWHFTHAVKPPLSFCRLFRLTEFRLMPDIQKASHTHDSGTTHSGTAHVSGTTHVAACPTSSSLHHLRSFGSKPLASSQMLYNYMFCF
jgi:hypothetical protein